MMELKDKAEENLNNYQIAVEEANEVIGEKIEEYNMLIEAMLQLEENRINFTKSLLSRNFLNCQTVAKSFVSKLDTISNCIETINNNNELKLFVKNCQNDTLNPLFLTLECYLYKPA